jgi:hypothetical protein
VTASAGFETIMSASAQFDLTIKNPCIDPSFAQISKTSLPQGLSYTLTSKPQEDGYTFVHSPFVFETLPKSHGLCGSLSYSATFDGQPVDETSAPMRYDSELRTFTVFSENI